MKLEDLEIYNLSMELSNKVYSEVIKMQYFVKDTLGKQWIRAADSVCLNLSEGFGRFSYRDSRNFSIIARGSLYESKTCLTKAFQRSIISEDVYTGMLKDYNNLGVKLNNYINSQTKMMNKVR